MSDQNTDKPIIGITLGDYNGIGPEVILKALEGNQLARLCTPVIYGSLRVLNQYRNLFEMKDWTLHGIQRPEQANPKLTNVITCWPDQQTEIQPGKITPEAGQGSLAALNRAVEDLKSGSIQALVTGPINKDNIQSETFKFPGHTEYLAEAFNKNEALMFMVAGELRVGVLTGHIPLGKVASQITPEKLSAKIEQILQSLKGDFGIKKPKLAVLGLNPHAGENGLLGSEEIEIIQPVIRQFKEKGHLVIGPFPADGFFAAGTYKQYDAVLAMYHDQGLVPFKTLAFNEGVNFTAGLSIVRTSPDHGTAYNIAGKNIAEPGSLLQAIYLACDVSRFRIVNSELNKNALISKPQPSESQHPAKAGGKQRF
ncbi:4-hydroxythreonine-4-phosphate dehydrogenase PdxA [Dyadobacter sediminis]|uniref:4-hydroxythreonine-4-phosphate dehydrogenase PdxA n=1 Tax=Dyadobacter sediminis TaxID=1493691 RepID=A0A5R9KKK2_9BACT|nr:4-hydroxythreonine-4-phosphate dehydrogenase PdxA [Dyadobacter sediminis]TLU96725.1 4-hydroxythreonine-4-phosphate dehydrogenase PdxA [Dyadobacter sediminis]GGB84660.1 4-hydroxythreonine-4-phosphate dehydrogenase [Dyadobacter sediminis]